MTDDKTGIIIFLTMLCTLCIVYLLFGVSTGIIAKEGVKDAMELKYNTRITNVSDTKDSFKYSDVRLGNTRQWATEFSLTGGSDVYTAITTNSEDVSFLSRLLIDLGAENKYAYIDNYSLLDASKELTKAINDKVSKDTPISVNAMLFNKSNSTDSLTLEQVKTSSKDMTLITKVIVVLKSLDDLNKYETDLKDLCSQLKGYEFNENYTSIYFMTSLTDSKYLDIVGLDTRISNSEFYLGKITLNDFNDIDNIAKKVERFNQ